MAENVTQAFEDMLHTLREDLRSDLVFALDVYGALCNMQWKHDDFDNLYVCSWRYAGELVAHVRNMGEDYLDFYCGGNEGVVSELVGEIFMSRGWTPVPYEDTLI